MVRRLCTILQFSIAVLAVSAPAFALSLAPPTVTPEPATAGLIGAGIAALFGVRYYRSRKR